jgi:thymidylate kinase
MINIVCGNYKTVFNIFLHNIEEKSVHYCICGNYENLPNTTNHDVDIWVSDINIAYECLKISAEVAGLKLYLSNQTANGYNLFLYRESVNFIEIFHFDLLQNCSWFSFIPLVSKSIIANNIRRHNNFCVANDEIEMAMHLFYPLVTNGVIKKKYREKIYCYRNSALLLDLTTQLFGKKYSKSLMDCISNKKWESIESSKNKLRCLLLFNILMGRVRPTLYTFFSFIKSNITRIVRPSGLFIAFIGLDGAGKTTLINSLNQFFQDGFASGKVKNYYWRPYLLPEPGRLISWFRRNERTEFTGASTDFFDYRVAKTKHSIFKSPFYLLKFFYYLLDFILGRLKYQGAWSRGGVVCFDRYYYDLLVFPERFGFKVPKSLIRFFSHFIPKPDICFYLYSPSKVLFERKGEITEHEIMRQTVEYDRLSMEYSNIIKVDTTKSIDETHTEIINCCLVTMRSRHVGK